MICVKGCVQGADRQFKKQMSHKTPSAMRRAASNLRAKTRLKQPIQGTERRVRREGLHELTGGLTGAGGWEDLILINTTSMFSFLRTGSNPTLLPVPLVQITAPDLDQSPKPLSTIVFLGDIDTSFFGSIFGFLCYDSCTCLLLQRQVGLPTSVSE